MTALPVPLRVLYVEDDDLVREVTVELLAAENRDLVPVGSAEEAMETFRSQPADLVITDVSLPVMSGLDLARHLLQVAPGLPIIIASGYTLDGNLDTLGPGVRSIIKPFEVPDIEALITELASPRL